MTDDYDHLEGYNPDADLKLGCGLPTEFKIKRKFRSRFRVEWEMIVSVARAESGNWKSCGADRFHARNDRKARNK